jgi:hypothetical protein
MRAYLRPDWFLHTCTGEKTDEDYTPDSMHRCSRTTEAEIGWANFAPVQCQGAHAEGLILHFPEYNAMTNVIVTIATHLLKAWLLWLLRC